MGVLRRGAGGRMHINARGVRLRDLQIFHFPKNP